MNTYSMVITLTRVTPDGMRETSLSTSFRATGPMEAVDAALWWGDNREAELCDPGECLGSIKVYTYTIGHWDPDMKEHMPQLVSRIGGRVFEWKMDYPGVREDWVAAFKAEYKRLDSVGRLTNDDDISR